MAGENIMTKKEYMQFHQDCCNRMIDITAKKNSDYTGASGDPFSNFNQIGGLVQLPSVVEIGFLTRMSDKISRIGSFVTKGFLLVNDESVEDTLLDLANYCILFAGYIRSKRGEKKYDTDNTRDLYSKAPSPSEALTGGPVESYRLEKPAVPEQHRAGRGNSPTGQSGSAGSSAQGRPERFD
jgi:hypothetical protein